MRIVREIFRSLPSFKERRTPVRSKNRKHAPDEIYGIVARDPRRVYDIRRVISCIVDGQLVSGIQGALWPNGGLRFRTNLGLSRRHHCAIRASSSRKAR